MPPLSGSTTTARTCLSTAPTAGRRSRTSSAIRERPSPSYPRRGRLSDARPALGATRSTPQVRSELPLHVAPVEREEGGGEGVVAVFGKQLVLDAEEVVLGGQAAFVHDGDDALGHWIDVFGL